MLYYLKLKFTFSVDPPLGGIPSHPLIILLHQYFLFRILISVEKIIILRDEEAGLTVPGSTLNQKISSIAGVLLDGGVIILPASTVYGLSCCWKKTASVKRIYAIKKRSTEMPFIVLLSDRDQLQKLVLGIGSTAEKIIKNFWEGKSVRPVTLIFKKCKIPGREISGETRTIAVRIAVLPFVRQIIRKAGPIVSTSATLSGSDTNPTSVEDIPFRIRDSVDMIVESEVPPSGIESTVVDVTGSVPVLVREGEVKFESIKAVLR
jgi:L-threonylcarbamoyladenylate synthase